jgi:dipeptidyl aminopeptidase/acylaminoacyl peptidase
MLPVAKFLFEAGFSIFMYDARNHGESEYDGPITLKKISQDILSAYHTVRNLNIVDEELIGVLGHSLGAAAAIVAASKEPGLRCIISSASYGETKYLFKRYQKISPLPLGPLYPLFYKIIHSWVKEDIDFFSPNYRIKYINAPILLFHGEDDLEVLKKESESILENSKTNHCKLILIPKRGHYDLLRDKIYRIETIKFLENNLRVNNNRKVDIPNSIKTEIDKDLIYK